MSDLWERANNAGELFLSTDFPYGPLDDPDGDGWTNAEEAAAGTNPFDPNPPDGLIQPQTVHIPESWADIDDDGLEEHTLEEIQVTWPQITGKAYTVFFSPDLIDWLPVGETFVGSETEQVYHFPLYQIEGQPPPPDKQFWRIKIGDVDSDGDGLTDAEEAALGTDPDSPQTVSGYPDMWLAEQYWATLLSAGFSSLDLDGDPDGDGLTNAQEDMLGKNRYVADNDAGIVQDSIRNGKFSEPSIGSGERPENDSTWSEDQTWDYWEGLLPDAAGKTSWTAVVGTNIEYQTVTPKEGCGQYVELKAEPENHYGIKQTIGTRIGVNYMLVLDCRARAVGAPEEPLAPEESNFEIQIEGTTQGTITKSIDFSAAGTPTPPGNWTTVPVVFTASDVTVKISLVPVYNVGSKMGGLVDNVDLLPVEVVEVSPKTKDEEGNDIAGSEKPSTGKPLTPFVELNPVADKIAHRELKVKIGEALQGKTVTWTLEPVPDATPATIRGAWTNSTTHPNRFEASATYGANGFTSLSQASSKTTVANDGFTAIRVNVPPIGFNQVRIKIQVEGATASIDLIDMEVPGVVVIDPGHGGTTNVQGSLSNNAVSPSGVLEKTMTLDYGLALRDSLRAKRQQDKLNLRVFMTRQTDDENPTGADRAHKARDNGADVLFVLHFNSDDDSGTTAHPRVPHRSRGTLECYRIDSNVFPQEDTDLSSDLIDCMVAAMTPFDAGANHRVRVAYGGTGLGGPAVSSDAYNGNTATYHPIRTAYIEGEFIDFGANTAADHTDDAVDILLNTGPNAPTVKTAIADSIRDGILQNLRNQP